MEDIIPKLQRFNPRAREERNTWFAGFTPG